MELLKIEKRKITDYNMRYFQCQICSKTYERNLESKIYLKNGEIALGKEICCSCGYVIRTNRVLNYLNFLKNKLINSIISYHGNSKSISLYDTLKKSIILNDIYYYSKEIHNFRTFFKI